MNKFEFFKKLRLKDYWDSVWKPQHLSELRLNRRAVGVIGGRRGGSNHVEGESITVGTRFF